MNLYPRKENVAYLSSYLSLLVLILIVHIFELDDRLSVHVIRILVILLAVVLIILPVVGILSALVMRRRLA